MSERQPAAPSRREPSEDLRPELERAHAEMLALLDNLDDAALSTAARTQS
jgi:hypothetical protein